jgi:thiamine biosynthesis protein ThiI
MLEYSPSGRFGGMAEQQDQRPAAKLVLLRFSGDIHIKARATRHQFVRRLLHNLRDAISSQGVAPRLRLSHNRIFVELPGEAEAEPLTRVFGIQSISVAEEHPGETLEQVVRTGEELFRERVRGRRFAVRARRVGNRREDLVSGREVEPELGAALLPVSAGVDLDDPEVTAHVELTEGRAYFFTERLPASGGLPLGVEGRAVALVSGGFDSAVAAWQLLRRGVALEYVFCNLGGATHRLGALRVMKVLADRWHYGDRPVFHCVDFEPVVAELRAATRHRYWQVLLKRLMLRAADRIAAERRALAIVTGEAVGQVSSQTLQNLAVISRATDRMILRPLVGSNKEAIIRDAERIGTFELSSIVGEYCDLVPRRPATAASLEAIEAEEARLTPAVLERAVATRRVIDLRGLAPEDLWLPELELERIPAGATVIDLRDRAAWDSWHWEGALRLDFAHALRAYPSFERGPTYVLYCDYGLMSAHLAELMRKEGFEAFHVRGGTRSLRRLNPEPAPR